MKRLTPTQTSHLFVFVLCLGVVIASAVLTPSDSAVSLFGYVVPPLCTWKQLTGMDCPGCGLTRSFTYMGHGEIGLAFAKHYFGPILYTAVAAMVPWHGYKLVRSFLDPEPPRRIPLGARPVRD